MITDVKELQEAFMAFRKNHASKVSGKTIALIGQVSSDSKELRWSFVDPIKYGDSPRYSPLFQGGEKIWLYKCKEEGGKEVSCGIYFRFDCVYVVHDLRVKNNQVEIEVSENAFFWWFNSEQKVTMKSSFRRFDILNIEQPIANSGIKNMDSNSPIHPPAGNFSSPTPF